MVGDPFLNYLALGVLVFVVVVLFYGIIAIHDIPAEIAHSRNSPHEDADACRRMGQPVSRCMCCGPFCGSGPWRIGLLSITLGRSSLAPETR